MPSTPLTSIADFANLARGYCAWCEGVDLGSEQEFQAAFWLASLYAAALGLPAVSSDNNDDLPVLPHAEFDRAKTNLSPFNGWYYRECFDPDPTLDEPTGMGDVGDDLLDIYKDLKAGLVVFDGGDSNDASWHWSFLHRIHWGRHAVGAMFALHCMHISKSE